VIVAKYLESSSGSELFLLHVFKILTGLLSKWTVWQNEKKEGHPILRPALTTWICPQEYCLPRGVLFAHRGELWPLEGMFTPSFTPRCEHTLLFRKTKGRSGYSTRRITSLLGTNFMPGSQLYPGDNFTPGCQLYSWGSNFDPMNGRS
jgi:hypothetical protein